MSQKPLKILLVDDNEDQVLLFEHAMQKSGMDYRVVSVEDGESCLERIKQEEFDGVVLDYHLPRMNGLDLLSEIQSLETEVPVVMVTGQGDEGVAVEAMKRGAFDYIIKNKNYLETLTFVIQKAVEKSQMKKNLNEASLRSEMLYEISLSVTMERDVQVIATLLVEGSVRLMGAEGAIFFLFEPNSSNIIQCETAGVQIESKACLGPVESVGILGLAFKDKKPVTIERVDPLSKQSTMPKINPPIRHLLSVPLLKEGRVSGILTIINKRNGTPFSPEDITTCSTLSVHAGVAFDNAHFLKEMERRAITDSLTGLYNHKEFQKRLRNEIERGTRYGKEFSLLMLDIDYFKVFNDAHGHQVGDSILKEIASIIESCIRNVDLASRYGGEEFAVILPETFGEHAEIVAERIRRSISERSFTTTTGHSTNLSASIGVASFPHDAQEPDDLVRKADQALYFAKRDGRNLVCCYRRTLKSTLEKDKNRLNEILKDPEIKVVRDLAAAIDSKSPFTRGHSEAVLQYAMVVGEAMELNEEEKKSLQMASLLHDIGAISIPDTIINKPGPLTIEERKIIQAHPGLAQMLIKGSSKWESVMPAILYHHERYDGKGYPNGIGGEDIPILARILSVVESYYAMISVRAYRPRMSEDEAISQLEQGAGSQFDPGVVRVFVDHLNRSRR